MSEGPTSVEVDAAERVIAEAAGMKPDGYWRETATDVLRAAEAVREPEDPVTHVIADYGGRLQSAAEDRLERATGGTRR